MTLHFDYGLAEFKVEASRVYLRIRGEENGNFVRQKAPLSPRRSASHSPNRSLLMLAEPETRPTGLSDL